jgi:hypothetical protein
MEWHDRISQEDRQDQRTEQRGQFLEQVPPASRTYNGRGYREERDQLAP